jgi:hypothetical protein
MNVYKNKWMSMNGINKEDRHEWINARIMYDWYGLMNGWHNEWMNERINKETRIKE